MSSCFTSVSDGMFGSSDLFGAKVQIYFGLSKKKCTLLCIFKIKARFARMGFGSNEQRGVRK